MAPFKFGKNETPYREGGFGGKHKLLLKGRWKTIRHILDFGIPKPMVFLES